MLVPKSRVHDVDMAFDEALKYITSMGVVAPRPRPPVAGKRGAVTTPVPGATNIPAAPTRQ